MEQHETVKLLVSETGALADQLSSLALVICGGIAALVIQMIFHNAKKGEEKIYPKARYALIISFLVEAASIMLGYITKASILTNIAFYQGLTLIKDHPLGKQPGMQFAIFTQWISVFQFITFISGVLLVFWFVAVNLSLIVAPNREVGPDASEN